jgi:hypothetical protein
MSNQVFYKRDSKREIQLEFARESNSDKGLQFKVREDLDKMGFSTRVEGKKLICNLSNNEDAFKKAKDLIEEKYKGLTLTPISQKPSHQSPRRPSRPDGYYAITANIQNDILYEEALLIKKQAEKEWYQTKENRDPDNMKEYDPKNALEAELYIFEPKTLEVRKSAKAEIYTPTEKKPLFITSSYIYSGNTPVSQEESKGSLASASPTYKDNSILIKPQIHKRISGTHKTDLTNLTPQKEQKKLSSPSETDKGKPKIPAKPQIHKRKTSDQSVNEKTGRKR